MSTGFVRNVVLSAVMDVVGKVCDDS